MKCKNIECENKTESKRIYCSLKCRNYYVNKYIRDYSKISKTLLEKGKIKKTEYLKYPKKCKNCKKVISYEKRENIFCNHSCAATITNREKPKGIKRNFTQRGLEACRQSAIKNFCKGKQSEPKKCKNCTLVMNKNLRNKNGSYPTYCSKECKNFYRRKNTSAKQKYKLDTHFKFSLNDYPNEFDFSLIKKFGWYSASNNGNNLDGVSRDHMLSVNDGFKMNIDPFLLSHPANCRLIKHTENISKNHKSIITLDELLKRIDSFDKKYGKYLK